MTIHRALATLKLLDAKINKKTSGMFCNVKKASHNKIGGVRVEDLENDIKSNFDSVVELISRRAKIKSAIIYSNANTKVEIGGEIKTVAEWIDLKSSIAYELNLLTNMNSQYTRSVSNISSANEKVDTQAENYVNGLYEDKNSVDPNKIKDLKKDYIDQNKFELVDPIGIKTEIDKLEERIKEFEMNIDFSLSESNAITVIEI